MINNCKYNDKEMKQLLSSIVILIDSRERGNKQLLEFFDKNKIAYKIQKLDYGDYSCFLPANEELGILRPMYFDREVMVEKKHKLDEICSNLGSDRTRLERELAFAPKHKVILIVEDKYDNILTNKYGSKYSNKSLLATLHTFWHRYGCPIFFVDNDIDAAVFIKYYLEYYVRERLK